MKGRIYTKTGDTGETSLFGGTRVSKADIRVDTYGTVDELNSVIGVAAAHLKASQSTLKTDLEKIQWDLLVIGAALANPEATSHPELASRISEFEQQIDLYTEKLPELHNFILPGGGKAGSLLHQARTVCRRAERRIIELSHDSAVDGVIIQYFNRLSDLLFTYARYVNYLDQKKETIWITG